MVCLVFCGIRYTVTPCDTTPGYGHQQQKLWVRCGRTAAGWRPHGYWLPNSKLGSVAIVYSGIKHFISQNKWFSYIQLKLLVIKKLWADCTYEMPSNFQYCQGHYSDSIWTPVLYQVTSGHCSACDIILHDLHLYSRLQCQEGDCRILACDVVLSAFVWWLVRLHGDLLDSRHPAVSCQSYRTWQLKDFASPEWIHPLWSILQSFRTGCTGCKIIAHSALFSL